MVSVNSEVKIILGLICKIVPEGKDSGMVATVVFLEITEDSVWSSSLQLTKKALTKIEKIKIENFMGKD